MITYFRMIRVFALISLAFIAPLIPISAAAPPDHPMDPLSAEEYARVVSILKEQAYIGETALFPLITLHEPAKEQVLVWKRGDPIARQAFAIVKQRNQIFEGVIDLTRGEVVSWQEVHGVQPNILLTEEWSIAQRVVISNRDWREALRKRGISSLRNVVLVPNTIGSYGLAEEDSRRLVKVVCYESSGTKNYWGRPVEGLIAMVDLNTKKVVQLIDTGTRPIPDGQLDLEMDSVGQLRKRTNPIAITQPDGPTYTLDGQWVNWQKWQFHFRIDARLGPIISLVRYKDGGKMRSILYQGSLSELFVPYMDPDTGWYFRTYMDAGAFGIGKLAAPLEAGQDCPSHTTFFDAVFADDYGEPYVREQVVGLFERDAGNIAWRHYEAVNEQNESRKSVELVLRFVAAVGNYDYVLDWVFRQDGSIRIGIGATGIEQVKAIDRRIISDVENSAETAFGHMVAENTVAVNHDHFFCYRLDMDVDGPKNSFQKDRLETKLLDDQGPRKSIWTLNSSRPATEAAAKMRINLEQPALWRVINPEVRGPLGYPVSYHLKPKGNAVSLLAPDDFLQQRAGFSKYHLWVTPYHPQERYAAGVYPNQSNTIYGLPKWTSADRSIQQTDIVLWYTVGFHHVVRAEDWPVLPTSWHEFELRPFDFFSRNPALDLSK